MNSRKLWMGLMLLVVVTLAVAPPAAFAQEIPKVDVHITNSDGSGVWYKNPIIVGGAAVLFVLLIALASRGGSGTTVVKT